MHERVTSDVTSYEAYWNNDDPMLRVFLNSAIRFRVPSLLAVYGGLRSPVRVLDYGCGNGALTWWLWRHGFGREIVGLDISATGIASANRRFGGPGLHFECFDPRSSLQHLGRFDVVVCSHVLEHLDTAESAIEQMKPLSNLFLFEVPLEDCLAMNASALLKRTSRTNLSDHHLQFWNKRTFEQFLMRTGLLLARRRIYAAAPYSDGSRLRRAVQRTVHKAGLGCYGALFGTNFTCLCVNL